MSGELLVMPIVLFQYGVGLLVRFLVRESAVPAARRQTSYVVVVVSMER